MASDDSKLQRVFPQISDRSDEGTLTTAICLHFCNRELGDKLCRLPGQRKDTPYNKISAGNGNRIYNAVGYATATLRKGRGDRSSMAAVQRAGFDFNWTLFVRRALLPPASAINSRYERETRSAPQESSRNPHGIRKTSDRQRENPLRVGAGVGSWTSL
jgi:hypothetical protein